MVEQSYSTGLHGIALIFMDMASSFYFLVGDHLFAWLPEEQNQLSISMKIRPTQYNPVLKFCTSLLYRCIFMSVMFFLIFPNFYFYLLTDGNPTLNQHGAQLTLP